MKLIEGTFQRDEFIELLRNMLEVKIKFHEDKIAKSHHEEDIAMREKRIQDLQHEYRRTVERIKSGKSIISASCTIEISES